MIITLLDKDQFASILRFGEIKLPSFLWSAVSDELNEEDALSLILSSCNPVEYPSEYVIALCNDAAKDDTIKISDIVELIATDYNGKRNFETQFRDDLHISEPRYSNVFEYYLLDLFEKKRIKKGIDAFRTLCGLTDIDSSEETDAIHNAMKARVKYRHHHQLPIDLYNDPYQLMLLYDRHSPYPNSWAGFFYDVIEMYCYHVKPDMGYMDMPIENTNVFRLISSQPKDINTAAVLELIKNEVFTIRCNEFFHKKGGFLVPYIFFILRARLRVCESFTQIKKLALQIKQAYPDAFDTACTYIGGFFGYDKFYDDLYSELNLPIFNKVNFGNTETPKGVIEKDAKHSENNKELTTLNIKRALKITFPKKSEEYFAKLDATPVMVEEMNTLLLSDTMTAEKFKQIFAVKKKPKEELVRKLVCTYNELLNNQTSLI